MAGKFQFSLKEYQEAAVKYRADLLMLPIVGIGDTLQYMTGRPGIRYKERVGNLTGDAQFAPYNPQRAVDYTSASSSATSKHTLAPLSPTLNPTRLSLRFSAQAPPKATVR